MMRIGGAGGDLEVVGPVACRRRAVVQLVSRPVRVEICGADAFPENAQT
jgi:hypothetical protein